MAKLIRNRRMVEDGWRLLPHDAAAEQAAGGEAIVPLALWKSSRDALIAAAGAGRLGVWLDGADEPGDIAADLDRFAVVAVRAAKFGDGRINSTGRLLRERYGYKGELRAFGDLLRDQLLMLERCGFDAFALRDTEDLEASLSAFGEFSDQYQASAMEPQPLFRRRLAAGR
jgi:uncharacterized protein (DUF934 family)